MTAIGSDIPQTRAGFADSYTARPGVGDEMIDTDGSLRPHWRMFVSMMDDLGPAERTRRWEQAKRLIHDNGVTHNVYGDPDGLDRPWNLDFVPLLFPSSEWTQVSTGLAQRAKLLDLLLADLYGPARSISEGIIPPELLFRNPSFLRPCHGIIPPLGRWLHLYAADLVRGSDGSFQVLTDRTQAPSGAGYSLENRIVVSRILPTIFRACSVERLAPFFMALRQSMTSLAPASRENPRVVLLTPGPYNETYFEHAYLARYLGYTLVHGNDLTVRDYNVYLKTLGGLQRVDVILRRTDDDFCDPLELFSNSYLGVPGLLEAVRAGTVAVANALGTGALESPAFMPFLPGLCRRFLNEELKLPSVRSWWCGQPKELQYVLDNIDSLVIKPAFVRQHSTPIFTDKLSKEDRAKLIERLKAQPYEFVAQDKVVSFTAPVLLNDQLQSRHLVMRAYMVANQGNYTAMNGGLTRLTESADSLVVSLQKGGGSKDTWVLADAPVEEVSLLKSTSIPLELSRGGGDLPSRVADDLFWLGRYVQRAEAIVRLGRGTLSRMLEQSGSRSDSVVTALLRAMTGHTITGDHRAERMAFREAMLPAQQEGLRSSTASMHGLARVLRDRISGDAWRTLQSIEREVANIGLDIDDDDQLAGMIEFLNRLIQSFAAFTGLSIDSMTRGQAWRFLDMGHRIERAIQVTRLIHNTLVEAYDEPMLLESVLDIADSSLTYRRRYLTHLELPAVLDLLIADETNPRAVAFQIVAIEQHLQALPRESRHPRANPDRLLVVKLRDMLQLTDLAVASELDGKTRHRLDHLLSDTLAQLGALSEAVSQIYFNHAAVSRRLLLANTDIA